MPDKLDFSLPKGAKKRDKAHKFNAIVFLMLIVLLGINIFLVSRVVESKGFGGVKKLSPDETKTIAQKLAERNLYEQSASVWKRYLQDADLSNAERARVLFNVGSLLQKSGEYSDAIEYYYRSEQAEKLDELESDISSHLADCFEKLNLFSARRYEMMGRINIAGGSDAGKIVAEIGNEKISEAGLDGIIEKLIDGQLSAYSAFMAPEQVKQQKQMMLEQIKGPKAKMEFLQSWLGKEVLYRKALEDKLMESDSVKDQIQELTKALLSKEVLDKELASKVNITQTDLQLFYDGNKDNFVAPAKASISHILVNTKEAADEVIGKVKAGGDFAMLASEYSIDEATKEKAGKIEADVAKGAKTIDGIGKAEAIVEKIFGFDGDGLIEEAFETEKGWEVVKVDSRTLQRQKAFEEVQQQIASELISRKNQDVQQELVKELMDKYKVVIHQSVLTGTNEGDAK